MNPKMSSQRCYCRVVDVQASAIIVDLFVPVAVGEGIVFDSGSPEGDEVGGVISRLFRHQSTGPPLDIPSAENGCVGLQVRNAHVEHVPTGSLCWRTKQDALEQRLRATYERVSSADRKRVAVDAFVTGEQGLPLLVRLQVRPFPFLCSDR
jgi:hypothetical protein